MDAIKILGGLLGNRGGAGGLGRQVLQQVLNQRQHQQQHQQQQPSGMEQEVYSVSLMAIDLDTNPEANYLRELAESLRIEPNRCNEIHEHYGAARLYR